MEIEMNTPQDAEVIEQPSNMKYKIITAPNVGGGLVQCIRYELHEKGILFITQEAAQPAHMEREAIPELKGFIPHGSFGAILPI